MSNEKILRSAEISKLCRRMGRKGVDPLILQAEIDKILEEHEQECSYRGKIGGRRIGTDSNLKLGNNDHIITDYTYETVTNEKELKPYGRIKKAIEDTKSEEFEKFPEYEDKVLNPYINIAIPFLDLTHMKLYDHIRELQDANYELRKDKHKLEKEVLKLKQKISDMNTKSINMWSGDK